MTSATCMANFLIGLEYVVPADVEPSLQSTAFQGVDNPCVFLQIINL